MNRQMTKLLLFCTPVFTACGTGTWVAELSADNTALNALASDAFIDNCTLEVASLPVVVLNTSISNASGFVYGLRSSTIRYSANVDTPIRLWDAELSAERILPSTFRSHPDYSQSCMKALMGSTAERSMPTTEVLAYEEPSRATTPRCSSTGPSARVISFPATRV